MNPEGRNKEGAIGGEEAPCSSLAVDSILRIGTAGLIWGLCFGPYGAGLFAGVFSYTRCGIQRYRDRNDWLNALTAGAVAGAAAVAGSPNWKQVAALAGLASAVFAAVDDHRSN
ncbi:outer envelope pore protein 16-4, chloroplastic isoform X3 [Diospyros lotus]|uniref:outer envelope pore protein 16-4, chloroplastic isoform X3 n=1 Tax=Diospyros lotus TaxID=55363 RepID=UPI0022550B95|nr:outer envelope pore protein 16-4, chloroplastic isoform X3 [Diospyros lotus]